MKIVHIDTGPDLRGGQEQLLLLARGLKQRGHEQLIVCPEGSRLEGCAREQGFRVFALLAHDPGFAHGIVQLRQQLLAERFEVLHAHDGRGQTIAWLASLGIPVRRVASRLVAFPPVNLWRHRLKYRFTCDGIIAVSDFVRQMLVDSGLPEDKIEVIRSGIEVPTELPGADDRSRVRAGWGFGEAEFVVGHVGAFTPEKGQDIAIEAGLILAEKLPEARLLLAGRISPKVRRDFDPRLEKARGRIRLLGYLENLSEFFPGLDLYIMPSKAEGLGLSALHAMAHGLPVVASRVGGLPEVVEDGATGWLVPPSSPGALAEAIADAARDRARLGQLGHNARERARQFSAEAMVARTEAFYRRLPGRAGLLSS